MKTHAYRGENGGVRREDENGWVRGEGKGYETGWQGGVVGMQGLSVGTERREGGRNGRGKALPAPPTEAVGERWGVEEKGVERKTQNERRAGAHVTIEDLQVGGGERRSWGLGGGEHTSA
jgi:hypothetical protein